MSYHYDNYDEDAWEDLAGLPPIRNMSQEYASAKRISNPGRRAELPSVELPAELVEQAEREDRFHFTYHASRHERIWLDDSLGSLFEQHWLDDVLRLLKGGKEANVYQCLANPMAAGLEAPYIAAKVYRPRRFRNLKKDHLYREGRQNLDSDGRVVKNHGMLHAMEKRTAYGQELLHTSWIEHEYQTLRILHAAGADVPRPFTSANNAILMSYIGGEEGAAPALNTISLRPKEARRLFERVLHNIELMLANNRIHADLSAYNILYWDGEITLIDFPQAIHPDENRSGFRIFERDVLRICEYFAAQGVRSNPRQLAAEMWQSHQRHLLPEVDPGILDAESDEDRDYWEKLSQG